MRFKDDKPLDHVSSAGQEMAVGAWLDGHFDINRGAYEAQVRAVGFQAGWCVLDAGCGSGSFLQWLSDLVGPTGRLAALDLAPENIAVVETRLAEWQLQTPVEAEVGSVLALPYSDASFDAVWCANTTEYLTDDELNIALAEMRRVIRPGGILALKDTDATLQRFLPAPIGAWVHTHEALARAGRVQSQGCLRACTLPARLREAGFTAIRRETTLIEHNAPLPTATRAFIHDFFVDVAARNAELDVPDADREFWASLCHQDAVNRLLSEEDFYLCDANILALGTSRGPAR